MLLFVFVVAYGNCVSRLSILDVYYLFVILLLFFFFLLYGITPKSLLQKRVHFIVWLVKKRDRKIVLRVRIKFCRSKSSNRRFNAPFFLEKTAFISAQIAEKWVENC